MSLLDDEDVLFERCNTEILVRNKMQEIYATSLFAKGSVVCVVADDEINLLTGRIADTLNINIDTKIHFAKKLQSIINHAFHPELKKHSSRDIISLDCRELRKGDAYGWMSHLADVCNDQIVAISNITEIPNGNPDIYDDPNYVANLLLRSWKNEIIHLGDKIINRKNLTIILTCPLEDQEILFKECGLCSYKWLGIFEEWNAKIEETALQLVNKENEIS